VGEACDFRGPLIHTHTHTHTQPSEFPLNTMIREKSFLHVLFHKAPAAFQPSNLSMILLFLLNNAVLYGALVLCVLLVMM